LSTKRKISRKKLLKGAPSEVITMWKKTFDFFEENSRIFYIVVTAIITFCICGIVFSFFYFQHQKKAKTELSQVIIDYNLAENDEEKLLLVLDDLNSTLKSYPITNQRKTILLYRGHVLYYLGRYTEALSDYEKAERKFGYPMKTIVIESIGYSYEKLEDYENASKAFLKILNNKNEQSYLNLIRSLKKEGKDDEAKEYSIEFLKFFPNSSYVELIMTDIGIDEKDLVKIQIEDIVEEVEEGNKLWQWIKNIF
jgi:tetratricopeptide (TPR) repeat protein